MTVHDIHQALWSKWHAHYYKFLNIYFFGGFEQDWLSFNQTGYSYEVEIKTSLSDFRADFKKGLKHEIFRSVGGSNEYITIEGYKAVSYTHLTLPTKA